jgi:predicted DCC family thiol-disulfide oxidoreductase YuxK
VASSELPVRYSEYRVFALRHLVALFALCVFVAMPKGPEAPFPDLADSWLELPLVLRGSGRLLGILTSLWLLIGWGRRLASVVLAAVTMFFSAYGQVDGRVGAGIVVLALCLFTFPGSDVLALPIGRERKRFDAKWTESWFRVVWALGGVLWPLSLLLGSSSVGVWVVFAAAGLGGFSLFFEPSPKASVGALVCLLVGIATAPNPFAPVLLLPIFGWLLFDERWFRPRVSSESVVFFDGHCSMCNDAVRFVMKEEASHVFRFAPLQGETAKEMLPPRATDAVDTMMLSTPQGTYQRSEAALRIARGMGGFWATLWIGRIVPLDVRDAVYDWIAKNRYRWFPPLDACPIPTPAERERFLP